MAELDYLLGVIERQQAQIDAKPVLRWATVVAVEPLVVLLDGDDAPLDGKLSDAAPNVFYGDRVVVALQARRAIVLGRAGGDTFVRGDLEAAYLTGGPAKVRVGGTLLGPFPWAARYDPQGPRTVKLARSGSSYEIAGQSSDFTIPLALNSGWDTYDVANVVGAFADTPKATKLPLTGAVVLSGLIRANSVSSGSEITVLPVGFRPDYDTQLPLLVGDLHRDITIKANGQVIAGASWTSPSYVSLDGLTFLAADPSRTWTALTGYGSGIGAYSTSTFGTPAWWKDPCGFVWFRGKLIINSGTPTDNFSLVALPAAAGCYNSLGQHIPVAATPYMARLVVTYNAIKFKNGSPSGVGSVISLANLLGVHSDANAKNWWAPVSWWGAGWNNYDGSWPQARFCLREDGLRFMTGLIAGGSNNAAMFRVPTREFFPLYGTKIFLGCANGPNRARFDIVRETDATGKGGVVAARMSNTGWTSLDGIRWVP